MPLGLFQILNLLRQRVHFFVFAWADLNALAIQGMEKAHLDRITTTLESAPKTDEFLRLLGEKGLEVAAPILLVDDDGLQAAQLAAELESYSYLNVYYAQAGLQGLLRERNQT